MQLVHGFGLARLYAKLPTVLALLLAIVCGFLVARLVWQFGMPADQSATSALATPQAISEATPSHATHIANQHLFGIAPPSAKPSAPTPSAAPLPNVVLLGVSTISPKLAIISLNNQEKVYRLGEKLKPSEAELVGIEAEAITLKYNGQKKTIALRKPPAMGAAGNAMMGDELSGGVDTLPTDMPGAAEMPADAAMPLTEVASNNAVPNADQPAVANNGLAQFHKEVLANPSKFMDLIAPPSPVMKEGKMLGFRIMPGKNIALFNQTGLQPGDIVTKINGTALDSVGAGIQALQNNMQSNNLNLEVDRGGQSTPIGINF